MPLFKVAKILSFSFRQSDIEIGVIGEEVDLKYDYEYLGDNGKILDDIINGKKSFAKVSFDFCFELKN